MQPVDMSAGVIAKEIVALLVLLGKRGRSVALRLVIGDEEILTDGDIIICIRRNVYARVALH